MVPISIVLAAEINFFLWVPRVLLLDCFRVGGECVQLVLLVRIAFIIAEGYRGLVLSRRALMIRLIDVVVGAAEGLADAGLDPVEPLALLHSLARLRQGKVRGAARVVVQLYGWLALAEFLVVLLLVARRLRTFTPALSKIVA